MSGDGSARTPPGRLEAPRSQPDTPTLVIAGERDNVYGLDLLTQTAEGVRDGRLIVYEGASHASAMTNKRLGDDVAGFLLPLEVPTTTPVSTSTADA